jgi:hypothetical protein
VVLTALAAILAMIPLSRSGFWGSMAVTIMGGLLVATVPTILFLPALYALAFRRSLDMSGAEASTKGSPQESKIGMWIRKMAARAAASVRGVLMRPKPNAAAVLLALVASAIAGGVLAAERGTAAERRACTPDVLRRCGDLGPQVEDASRVRPTPGASRSGVFQLQRLR